MNDPNSAEYDLLHVGGNYNHHGLLHQHQQPLTSPAEYEDPSLLLPGLIDTHFADAVPPTSYYGGPVSCAQVAPASWLTPLPTAVTMDARGAAVSTDAYHSYILDQPTFRYDSLVDPNATYYQPMSEPMAYHCGNDVLIESQENYAKKLTPETAVSDDAEILLATGFADASEVRSRSRSRRRRVPHLVKGGGGACDTSQADLMQSFEIKMDERPHSAASAVASTVINTSTITTSSASCLPVSSCLICGDKATGKHYGAYSCDGCKGFFRRSVRRKHTYSCRYNRACTIDKDMRNQCRFCRLKKCFRVGMNRASVQHERDKISNRRSIYDSAGITGTLVDISSLLRAEVESKEHSERIETIEMKDLSKNESLSLSDICAAMKHHLFRLINWAKQLDCFTGLEMQDQLTLLRGNAAELLLLSIVWQSICTTSQQPEDDQTFSTPLFTVFHRLNAAFLNAIKTGDYPPPSCSDDSKVDAILRVIASTIYRPLLELRIGETEFICLKAIIFLSAGHLSLTSNGRLTVEASRNRLQIELMNVMNDNQYLPEGRFGELLLLVPTLQRIASILVSRIEAVAMATNTTSEKPEEALKLDELLGDILLAGVPTLLDDAQGEGNSSTTAPPFVHLPFEYTNRYTSEEEVVVSWHQQRVTPSASLMSHHQQAKQEADVVYHLQPPPPGSFPAAGGEASLDADEAAHNFLATASSFSYQQEVSKE